MNLGAYLRLLNGPEAGRVFVLDELNIIGRAPDCDIALSHLPLSRRHAHIALVEGQWILTDLESANGSFVNGTRIAEPHMLQSGDAVRLGRLELVFRTGITSDQQLLQAEPRSAHASMAAIVIASLSVLLAWAAIRPHLGLAGRGGRTITAVIGDVLVEATLAPTLTPAGSGFDVGAHVGDPSALYAQPAPTPITTLPAAEVGRLAFTSDRDGNAEVYMIGGDGEDLMRLTSHLAADQLVDWLNADTLAIVSDRDGARGYYQISLQNLEVLEPLGIPGSDLDLAWSPGGAQAAFVRTFLDDSEVYISQLGGGGGINISQSPAADRQPAWSPDGQRLAFVSWREGDEFGGQIFVVNTEGAGPQRVTPLELAASAPAWSPDGRRIAFAGQVAGGARTDIYVIDVDGTGLTAITSPDESVLADEAAALQVETNLAPDWSPDGGRIAFQSNRDGNWEIYAVELDSSRLLRLTRNEAADLIPKWQPRNP